MQTRYLIGIGGILLCAGAWIALGVGALLHVGPKSWTALVFGAAIASEILIWCLAAMLGLSVFQMRRRIGQWLKRPFRKLDP